MSQTMSDQATTAPAASRGALLGIDVRAVVEELAPVWARHREELATVWARHDEELAPVRARHDEELATVWARHDEELAPVRARHREELAPVRARHDEELATVRARHDEELAPVRARLLVAVQDDPLCTWIVEHAMPAYPVESLDVLRAMPCTLADLDALAERSGWCGAWAEQVTAARVAGVLPQVTP